jgi:hypothetical protein
MKYQAVDLNNVYMQPFSDDVLHLRQLLHNIIAFYRPAKSEIFLQIVIGNHVNSAGSGTSSEVDGHPVRFFKSQRSQYSFSAVHLIKTLSA